AAPRSPLFPSRNGTYVEIQYSDYCQIDPELIQSECWHCSPLEMLRNIALQVRLGVFLSSNLRCAFSQRELCSFLAQHSSSLDEPVMERGTCLFTMLTIVMRIQYDPLIEGFGRPGKILSLFDIQIVQRSSQRRRISQELKDL